MPSLRSPRLEYLEDRLTPAQFGVPWADPTHLTVSFVADGAALGKSWTDGTGAAHQASTSNLSASMSATMSSAVWQGEILRALQTWASQIGVQVTQVADGGQRLGETGASQGDARFGDIRIWGAALSSDALAVTTPPGSANGTAAGDIVFNTNVAFGVGTGADLYTTALQEVGHALGLDNSTNVNSAMFELYSGVRTGLDPTDVTAIHSLYGSPPMMPPPAEAPSSAVGTLGMMGAPVQSRRLQVAEAGLVHLDFSLAQWYSGMPQFAAAFDVYDAAGNQVQRVIVNPGQTQSVDLLMAKGAYRIIAIGGAANGGWMPMTTYQVNGYMRSDPMGPGLIDPSAPPPPSSSSSTANLGWFNESSVPAGLQIINPFGTPIYIH